MSQINTWNMPSRWETAFWIAFGGVIALSTLVAAIGLPSAGAGTSASAIADTPPAHAVAD